MNADLKTRPQLITSWLVAEWADIGIRVLIGIPAFALSTLVIISLAYLGLNLSAGIQTWLIVGLSAVLFWIGTSLFNKPEAAFWSRRAS
jgi:hypothetical protein